MNRTLLSAAILISGLALSADSVPAVAASEPIDDEARAICAEADSRYKKLYADRKRDAGVVIVLQYKYTFCPWDLTVKAGSTVRWINVDKRTSHSVWFKAAGKKESERLFPEEKWEIKFTEPGAYPYLCGPHWEREDMKGTLRVIR